MSGVNAVQLSRLRGAARLLCHAVTGVTDVVERMHGTIQARPLAIGGRSAQRTRGLTGLVYGSVRNSIGLVGAVADTTLATFGDPTGVADESALPHPCQVVLNGICGDHLARTASPLAIPMCLLGPSGEVDPRNPRLDADATERLVLLAHGLCMSEASWHRKGHDHGLAIANQLAAQPLYLRYNSGLSIAANGSQLADLLETLIAHWPTRVEEIAIIGYSMGGLVVRSAIHLAREAHHRWPSYLRRIVFLGTPHHGAPLERGGAFVDQAVQMSAYSRPLAQLTMARSEGINDLRRGKICADGRHLGLPEEVACYAIAAALGEDADCGWTRVRGDGLVPVNSALGRHHDPLRDLAIPAERQWVAYGVGHFDLLSDPGVFAQIRKWLGRGC
jgi:pimeloyl-ACP methyl ester carboxylesterase